MIKITLSMPQRAAKILMKLKKKGQLPQDWLDVRIIKPKKGKPKCSS